MVVPFLSPRDFDIRPGPRWVTGDCTRVVALKNESLAGVLTPEMQNNLGNTINGKLPKGAWVVRDVAAAPVKTSSLVLFIVVYPCSLKASIVEGKMRKSLSRFCRRHMPASTRRHERRIERHHADRELRVISADQA